MNEIDRALQALYPLLEEAERLGLSRGVRLRIVAIIGDLEAVASRQAQAHRDHERGSEPRSPE
jgi:hypothetical protein